MTPDAKQLVMKINSECVEQLFSVIVKFKASERLAQTYEEKAALRAWIDQIEPIAATYVSPIMRAAIKSYD